LGKPEKWRLPTNFLKERIREVAISAASFFDEASLLN
jgi:hypothetical protein